MKSPDIVVASQGSSAFIHFADYALSRRDEVADWLGRQSWAGRIIKGENLAELGQIPAADVLAVDMAKSEGSNCNGVPGLTAMAVRFSDNEDAIRRDCGMHGGLGPRETQPTLIAVGNGFPAGGVVSTTSRSSTSRRPRCTTSVCHWTVSMVFRSAAGRQDELLVIGSQVRALVRPPSLSRIWSFILGLVRHFGRHKFVARRVPLLARNEPGGSFGR